MTRNRCFRAGSRGAEGGVETRLGNRDAEAVGPDQPAPTTADERQQTFLTLDADCARLRESGGDHAQRADALAQRAVGGLQHALARHGHHGEVDRVRISSIEL